MVITGFQPQIAQDIPKLCYHYQVSRPMLVLDFQIKASFDDLISKRATFVKALETW